MARPKKEGLEYFPVNVDFDEKIEAIELMHHNDGLVWVLRFWQKAYKTMTGLVDFNGLFAELFANKCRITIEKHQEILKTALSIDFCHEVETSIYTSNGIQKRISSVSKDRADAILRQEEKKKKSKGKKSKVKDCPDYSANNYDVPLWKQNSKEGFQEYLRIAEPEFDKLRNDYNFIADKKRFYPKINIQKSIDKMWEEYWGTEAGWNKRRKSQSVDLNWKRTIETGLSMPLNQVKIPYGEPDPEIVAIKARGIEI